MCRHNRYLWHNNQQNNTTVEYKLNNNTTLKPNDVTVETHVMTCLIHEVCRRVMRVKMNTIDVGTAYIRQLIATSSNLPVHLMTYLYKFHHIMSHVQFLDNFTMIHENSNKSTYLIIQLLH